MNLGYALFAWAHEHASSPQREISTFLQFSKSYIKSIIRIVCIYSCPSNSAVKNRMVYSSGARGVFASAKNLFDEDNSASLFAARKIETSDPQEITEAFLIAELGLAGSSGGATGTSTPVEEAKKPFAKPKGPGRRR